MPYSRTQVMLHWFSAAIILWATFSGFYVAFADAPAGLKQGIGFINVSLTTVLIPFFVLRLCLAIAGSRRHNPGEAVARIAHWALYAVTTVVLVTGVLMMERDIDVFHLVVIPAPLSEPVATAAFNATHKYACMVLAGLVALHVAAVARHHLAGNPVLGRMRW
ncbi:cytochrome b [Stenotrophomonas maltophilia]|uniref:cytochrome b n=1 Tax=Stenotrophomonas maltophilia TaxID=40324 RepID=UPI000C148CB7|nr:cytochrome b/b6 domain-containing protein [Stenotrophomonas maltophilia]